MRIIVSLLFILITIISVARPIDSFCIASAHSTEIQSGQVSYGYQAANTAETASADHLACDVCHIGHCSFTMSSDFITAHYGNIKLFGSIKNKIQFSEFNQNLFRPPIV